jgi:uncharacterized membrane protein
MSGPQCGSLAAAVDDLAEIAAGVRAARAEVAALVESDEGVEAAAVRAALESVELAGEVPPPSF